MKFCRYRLVVSYTLGIHTFNYAVYLLWNVYKAFFNHLIILDYVKFGVWCN